MKNITAAVIFFFTALSCFTQTVSVFLIKSVNNDLEIEKIDLSENEVQVFPRGGGSENISLVIPVSVGISGDLSKAADKSVIVARNKSGLLVISVQKPDGTQKDLISKSASELADYDIRVNITGTSQKKVFNIKNYDKITEDNESPVIDMFKGQIPMSEGDYSITTEITAVKKEGRIEGGFNIEYDGGYYFTKIMINNKEVNAIVDLGAANSFLLSEALSEEVIMYDVYASEVSAEGKKSIELPLSGFGGKVNNLRACDIQKVNIGSIQFTGRTFYVLDRLANSKSRKIEAIIGMDILALADFLYFEIPKDDKNGKCLLSKNSAGKHGLAVPFSLSHGHIFLNGVHNDKELKFLLDTGSPLSFLSEIFASENKIAVNDGITVYGADSNPVKTKKGVVSEIKIARHNLEDTEFYFVNGSILANYGLESNGGLLGTSFLASFASIEVDFRNNLIHFN